MTTQCSCDCHVNMYNACTISGGCGYLHRTQRVACVLSCTTRSGDPRPTDNGYLTCGKCAERLRGILVDIVKRYAIVGAASLETISSLIVREENVKVRRRSPNAESPADDHVISIRDHRSTAVEPGDPHSPLAILWSWAQLVRDNRNLARRTARPTVESEADTLLFHWDWVMRQPWVVDLNTELREVANQLRPVTGTPTPKLIGHCPKLVKTDGETQTCNTPLFTPASGDTVRCSSCGEEWPRSKWLSLGRKQVA